MDFLSAHTINTIQQGFPYAVVHGQIAAYYQTQESPAKIARRLRTLADRLEDTPNPALSSFARAAWNLFDSQEIPAELTDSIGRDLRNWAMKILRWRLGTIYGVPAYSLSYTLIGWAWEKERAALDDLIQRIVKAFCQPDLGAATKAARPKIFHLIRRIDLAAMQWYTMIGRVNREIRTLRRVIAQARAVAPPKAPTKADEYAALARTLFERLGVSRESTE